jgi:N-acetylmuramoyl-L-alanine amidase
MYKIALNAGHGLNTAGKRCLKSLDPNETREWQLNSRICNKIEEKLKAYEGYKLIRLDDITGKTDVALKTRTTKANEFGADFYLSIHHNAGVNGGNGGGIIAIVYTKVGNSTIDYQKSLYDNLIKHTGLKGNRSQPLQKQNLHEVRESKMSAVLLECGFMDSSYDVGVILTDKYADQVASACVEVLVKKGGLTKKAVEQPKAEKPKPTVTKPNSNYFPKYSGSSYSLVDALKSLGINSALSYRGKIAQANGIVKNANLYIGLKSHNEKMFALLKQGKLIKP